MNKDSISLWHDVQQDRFYLLNNNSGAMTRVNSNTEYVKEFDAALTGQVGYRDRVEYATTKNRPGYLPLKAASLHPRQSNMFYTPQCDKFEGYTHFPQPRTQPYFNQDSDLKLDPHRRNEIREQQRSFKPDSKYNGQLFAYEGLKRNNVGMSYLTNSVKEHVELMDLHKTKVMTERKVTQLVDMMTQSQPMLSTKTINGRALLPPNDSIIAKYKLQQQPPARTPHIKLAQIVEGQVHHVTPMEEHQTNAIEAFLHERSERAHDQTHFTQASSLYKLNTFDGRSFSSPFRQAKSALKTEDQFNRELQSQKWQLEAFKLPVQVEKSQVVTKGRFNVKMPPLSEQDGRDREIMKLLYPEMYVERVDPKKVKQEELRRKINRMKESEMLERNLRNKV